GYKSLGYSAVFLREYVAQVFVQGTAAIIVLGRLIPPRTTVLPYTTLFRSELDAATQERLQNASAAELERWTERILFADSLEAVFNGWPTGLNSIRVMAMYTVDSLAQGIEHFIEQSTDKDRLMALRST